jgi:hypothetical protein
MTGTICFPSPNSHTTMQATRPSAVHHFMRTTATTPPLPSPFLGTPPTPLSQLPKTSPIRSKPSMNVLLSTSRTLKTNMLSTTMLSTNGLNSMSVTKSGFSLPTSKPNARPRSLTGSVLVLTLSRLELVYKHIVLLYRLQ